jgi:hypothetical protein
LFRYLELGNLFYFELAWAFLLLALHFNYAVILVAICFLGASMIPTITASIEFAAEIAYPVGEATITGVISCLGQFASIIGVILLSLLLKIGSNFGNSIR